MMSLRGENVPTSAQEVLDILKKSPILKAVRFSWWPAEDSAEECDIEDSEVFSFTEGPLLVYLGSGEIVGVSSDESKNSIVIWLERDIGGNVHEEDIENDDELFPISNDDKKYSKGVWNNVSGKKVKNIVLIKRSPQNVNYEELPNEVGLIITMDSGDELVLTHQLCAKVSNFSVSDDSALDRSILGELSYLKM
jgi:hypothetical protein